MVMQGALRITTQVLPGKRIEVSDPELEEGASVEVVVIARPTQTGQRRSLVEFLNSLPPGPRSAESWEEKERQFQEERDAWDR